MNPFEEILLLPGAAPILGAKLAGRIIGRIADGFDEDPALGDMMKLYRAIEDKWPEQTMSLRDMYNLQLKDAAQDTESVQTALDGLTEEQKSVWLSEKAKEPRMQKLQQALPKIVDLYSVSTPDTESWDDLTTINQWSLLNATERGLHERVKRYAKWAHEDREKGRTESNAITLFEDANDAVQPLYDLVTDFLEDPVVAQALDDDAANGIRVPTRLVA